MNEENSVILIQRFRDGDEAAAARLFERYFDQVDQLAQRKLSPQLQRRIGSDDIAQSVYRSLFDKVAAGRFVIEEEGKLWSLLAKMTSHKVLRQVERNRAGLRDVSREQPLESGDRSGDGPDCDLSDLDGDDPQLKAIVDDALEYVLDTITPAWKAIVESSHTQQDVASISAASGASESDVRRVLTLRIKSSQGLDNSQIAETLDCSEVTIRLHWRNLLELAERLLAENRVVE